MAGIIRIRPTEFNQTEKGAQSKLARMLIYELSELRPWEELVTGDRPKECGCVYQGIRSTSKSYRAASGLAIGISQSGIAFKFSTVGQINHCRTINERCF